MKRFSSVTNSVTCTAGSMIVWSVRGVSMNGDHAMSKMIKKTRPFVLGSKKRQRDRFWEEIRRMES